MTTQADEGGSSGRCAIPNCNQPADGLLCPEHKPGYVVGTLAPDARA
jgi:hypothetical protein